MLFSIALAGVILTACNTADKPAETKEEPVASTVELPYTADFSSNVNQDVSDQDLLTVLNSYKSWENGDIAALRATLADSVSFNAWDGFKYEGPSDGLMERWSASRDSLSSVTIKMHAWTKNHFVDRDTDVIVVWYTEIDTSKDGKIDSATWSDINLVKDGKISWYSQYRQTMK